MSAADEVSSTARADSVEQEKRASAASPPVPKRQIPIKDTKEETGSTPAPLTEGADVGGQTLVRLISFRPFISYFCWLAHRQHPAAHRPETRVNALRSRNPLFYWLCVTGDMLVMLTAMAILIAAASATLYKTIWR
jgi:hypothetical protein